MMHSQSPVGAVSAGFHNILAVLTMLMLASSAKTLNTLFSFCHFIWSCAIPYWRVCQHSTIKLLVMLQVRLESEVRWYNLYSEGCKWFCFYLKARLHLFFSLEGISSESSESSASISLTVGCTSHHQAQRCSPDGIKYTAETHHSV